MIPGGLNLMMMGGRPPIPSDSLVLNYTMDNISGATLVDETGSYDGTITGATTASGQYLDALSFDGTNDSCLTTGLLSWTSRSYCFWFKPSATTAGSGSDEVFMTNTNNVNASVTVYFSSTNGSYRNSIRFFSGSDIGNLDWLGAETLDTAKFYFLVVDITGTSANSYLYDEAMALVKSASATLSSSMSIGASNDLLLGQIGGASAYADYDNDGVVLYDKILSADERYLASFGS